MQISVLIRCTLLLLITIHYVFASQSEFEITPSSSHNIEALNLNTTRVRRATGKPGFFRTLFSVIYEQWVDTKNTYSKVNTMINDNFLPEAEATTTMSSAANVSTTPVNKITRTEFTRILRRNVKGLARLFNIELRDALKQSDRNEVHFHKNVSKEVSKFL